MTRSVLKLLHFGKRLYSPNKFARYSCQKRAACKRGKNQSFDVQLLVLPILNLTALQQSTNFNSRTLYRTVTAKFLCDRALTGLNLCNVRQQVSSFQYDYIWWELDCLQLRSMNDLRFYDDAASQLWIISTCILQYFIGAAANHTKELVATGLVSSRFPIRFVHAFLFSSIRSTCPI